jgi:RHS repeat-associated protein
VRNGTYIAYDSLNRLSTTVSQGSANYSQWGLSWTYDRYGNRTAQTVTAGTGPSNSVTVSATTNQITTSGYHYDANGNMTNDGVNTLVYDAENRAISSAGAFGTATYSYDGMGRRVQKTVAGTTTTYVLAGSDPVSEYANGTLTNEYIRYGSYLLAEYNSGALIYHGRDHVSVRLTMDTNGNKLGEQGDYPFGEDWYMTNTTTKWHPTNYEWDAESGNEHATFRYDVNRLGRFLSVDPVRPQALDPQQLNRYSYVASDPIGKKDPDGRLITPCDLGGIGDDGCICDPFFGCYSAGIPIYCGPQNEGGCYSDPEPPPPPPQPTVSKCFAQLKFRGVAETLKAATHAFWWLQDDLGTHYIISGGPSNGSLSRPLGFLDTWESIGDNRAHYPDDNSGQTTSFDSGISSGACQGVESMLMTDEAYANNSIIYVFSGPNSNSFAHFLGANGGFYPSAPPRSLGWSTPVP